MGRAPPRMPWWRSHDHYTQNAIAIVFAMLEFHVIAKQARRLFY